MSQKVAQVAKSDFESMGMETPREIASIASIGAGGKFPNHMHKDLQNRLQTPVLKQALSDVYLWIRTKTLCTAKAQCKVLWPHELFGCLYSEHPHVFEQRFLGGDASSVVRFWKQMEGSSRYDGHPVRGRGDHKKCCIPIGLHGDGVTVTGVGRSWSKGCDAFSWSSLLTAGPSKW